MNDIKVSVVMAVYNSEKYLRKTLDTVISQTLKDIEIICVDDGSNDNSLSILREYEKQDPRIIVLQQTKASDGAALARNLGVENAKGDYVSVLDADDLFDPDMLKKTYEKAVETNAEAVVFDGDLYDEKIDAYRETGMILRKEFLPKEDIFTPSDNPDGLFFMTIGAAWNVLFSRELIRRENLKFHSFHHADDLGFVYLGFATAKKIAMLNERLIHYRSNNDDSQASNLEKWPEAAAGAMTMLKDELDARDLFETFRVAYTEIALHYFDLYLNRMPDYESFEKLYLDWKNRYLEELDLLLTPDERLIQNRIVKIRKRLKNLSPGQYLFEKEKRCGYFAPDEKWRTVIPPKSRVILYCAGKLGRELFKEFTDKMDYILTSWADSKYENYGYPVTDPDEALKKDYDFILVAIESENIFRKIKTDLVKKGAAGDRIIWAGEDNG